MKIVLLVEGDTERAFVPYVREFLRNKLADQQPRLTTSVYSGRIPKEKKLRRIVENLLRDRAEYVIALTDLYTGSEDFVNAADAKQKMLKWTGNNDRFYPHVAQYEFEAWLLPYWDEIQNPAKHNKRAPAGEPESVNHHHPPSWHIKEIFRIGKSGRDYIKPRDAKRLLQEKDLAGC